MKHVKKSVLLWYSAREIYDLVVDVEAYPKFLPWCDSATVLERHDPSPDGPAREGMTARLGLNFAGVRQSFTTRNEHMPGREVRLQLVDGPFTSLVGTWDFVPLGEPSADGQGAPVAGDGATACRIEFDLAYALKAGPLEIVLSPVFDRVANTFVDAFVKRAAQVYGER
jgi:ribosome-associated toxin RatA of RatAB toxin-antitoxin module